MTAPMVQCWLPMERWRYRPGKKLCCRPGMFLYLNIPSVAKYEWHPLSLAGSPSSGVLSVLMRSGGAPPPPPTYPILLHQTPALSFACTR